MSESQNKVWQSAQASTLAKTFALISDETMMRSFLRDVMTEKEIIEISARLEAAKMLRQRKKYTEIITATKLSSRTIARVSGWMQNGESGYEAAFETTTSHHSHISPARTE
jgi:TrpR-related protein YerC/YecD